LFVQADLVWLQRFKLAFSKNPNYMGCCTTDEVVYNDPCRAAVEKRYKITRHRTLKRRVWLRLWLQNVTPLRQLQICRAFEEAFNTAYDTPAFKVDGADPIQHVMDFMHSHLHDLNGVAKWNEEAEQWGYVYTHAIRAMCFAYASYHEVDAEPVMEDGELLECIRCT
jgi:hypothetical protein